LNTRSKQSRTDAKRTEILDSAAGALRRLGVRGAGMRQIAEAAGLSAGNLYYYFRNKDELVYYCQIVTLDRLLAVARQARRHSTSTILQLGELIEGHLRVTLGEHASGPLHLDFGDLPAPLLKKVLQKRDRYEREVRAILVEGQRAHELRTGDAKLDAFVLLGALNWATRWFQPGRGYDVAQVAAHHRERLLEGLIFHRSRS
jgi:AcrR family transcriptional regulator